MDISPSTLNFIVRGGKLGIYTLYNPPEELVGTGSPSRSIKEVCCGMFCLDGEVVFVHSQQVDKTGPSTLILVYTRG